MTPGDEFLLRTDVRTSAKNADGMGTPVNRRVVGDPEYDFDAPIEWSARRGSPYGDARFCDALSCSSFIFAFEHAVGNQVKTNSVLSRPHVGLHVLVSPSCAGACSSALRVLPFV